jgi:ribosomal protein S26
LVRRKDATKVFVRVSLIEPTLAREMRAPGAPIASPRQARFYCLACAVHYGIAKNPATGKKGIKSSETDSDWPIDYDDWNHDYSSEDSMNSASDYDSGGPEDK